MVRICIKHDTFLLQSFDSLPGFAEWGNMVRCSRQDMECSVPYEK